MRSLNLCSNDIETQIRNPVDVQLSFYNNEYMTDYWLIQHHFKAQEVWTTKTQSNIEYIMYNMKMSKNFAFYLF